MQNNYSLVIIRKRKGKKNSAYCLKQEFNVKMKLSTLYATISMHFKCFVIFDRKGKLQ